MTDLHSLYFTYTIWLQLLPVSLLLLTVAVWRFPSSLLSWQSLMYLWIRQRYRHPLQHLLPHVTSATTPQRALKFPWLSWLQYAVLLLLLHVCLAQPYRIGAKLPEIPPQRDAMFLVDTSVTMYLRDYLVAGQRTDRMSMLKSVLAYFITQLQGNRLGIMVFSEEAYTLVPLTSDNTVLNYQIQRLEPAVLTGRTSDLGKALLYADKELDSSLQKPALILITDATRPQRHIDPRAAAAYLAKHGFHLHVIAMGAASYAAEEQHAAGLVYHPANFRLLEEIASTGNGQFFWAKNISELNHALAEVQRIEKRQVEHTAEFVHLPLYQWPLLVAILWWMFWQYLPILKPYPRERLA